MTTRICHLGIREGEMHLGLIFPWLATAWGGETALRLSLKSAEQLAEAILLSVRQEQRRLEAAGQIADMESRSTEEVPCPTEETATPTKSDPPTT